MAIDDRWDWQTPPSLAGSAEQVLESLETSPPALGTYLDLSELDWNGDLLRSLVTIPGIEALADSPYLTAVTELNLGGNRIGDVAGRALAAAPHLSNRASIQIDGAKLSRETRTLLRKRFGQTIALM